MAQVVSETQHAHNNTGLCLIRTSASRAPRTWLLQQDGQEREVDVYRAPAAGFVSVLPAAVRSGCTTASITHSKYICRVTPCSQAHSRQIRMHYSFEYAQQVHLPSDPMQPGPLYFLVPRKCGIFGVCCEGLPRQMNFLVDEAHLISKGSNSVVSYMHYVFERFGLGETDVDLHCDNCSGQNKNRFVL